MTADADKYKEATQIAKKSEQVSIVMLQRRLKIGYCQALSCIHRMQLAGIIGDRQKGGNYAVEIINDR